MLFAASLLLGCGESAQSQPAPSGSAPAFVVSATAPKPSAAPAPASSAQIPVDVVPWVGIPRPVDEVEKVINPLGEKPYAGKTGTLKGKITIKGDPPPDVKVEIGPDCAAATAFYSKAFRVGEGGALPDALVTVTGYKGFVPVKQPYITATLNGCAYDQRTYAMTFGQRIEVSNVDPKLSHVPLLDPAPFRSVNVAMPQGRPIRLYAFQPAVNYVLRDYMSRTFLTARVFNLKFSTHDVSGADGTYEIANIPVGKVNVNAFLPAIDADGVGKEVEIKEGENTLDFELTYDAKKDKLTDLPADPWARTPGTTPTASGGFAQPPKKLPPKSEEPR